MDAPRFTVPVKDLDYGEQELDEDIPVDWLASVFAGTEAVPTGGPGHLTATLSKTGREIMVRGRARAEVTMPCARTLDPVRIPLSADLFLLLAPRPAGPPGPRKKAKHGEKRGESASRAGGPARARAQPQPMKERRKGPKGAREPEEPELSPEEAAEDTYDGEKVVLDGFIREFLLLELPLVPLREDLRSEGTPAIDVPPERTAPPSEGRSETAIDPRLQPLAALASRLKDKTPKKE